MTIFPSEGVSEWNCQNLSHDPYAFISFTAKYWCKVSFCHFWTYYSTFCILYPRIVMLKNLMKLTLLVYMPWMFSFIHVYKNASHANIVHFYF